jgi:hypothetical protein
MSCVMSACKGGCVHKIYSPKSFFGFFYYDIIECIVAMLRAMHEKMYTDSFLCMWFCE